MTRTASLAERLERHSIPEPNSGCLLWLGAVDERVYARVFYQGKNRKAHRVALEQKLGRSLLPGEQSCHKCDVTLCINEDHLFPGTQADNVADMRAKGRDRTRKNKSGFRGVFRTRTSFSAQITGWPADHMVHIGCFSTAEEAARAYDRAARERFGASARLNFPEDK